MDFFLILRRPYLIACAYIDFRFGENDSEDSAKTGLQLIYATGRQMKNKKQLLLIPITIWSGLEQGFFGADFTAVNIYYLS